MKFSKAIINLLVFAMPVSVVADSILEKIAMISEKRGPLLLQVFETTGTIDGLLWSEPDFSELTQRINGEKADGILLLTTGTLSPAERLILLHAFLYLPPEDYMFYLETLLELYDGGHVNTNEILSIYLYSPRVENRWFLSYNAHVPRLKMWLLNIKSIYQTDSNTTQYIERLLAGWIRLRDDMLREQDEGLRNRVIPLLFSNINETRLPDPVGDIIQKVRPILMKIEIATNDFPLSAEKEKDLFRQAAFQSLCAEVPHWSPHSAYLFKDSRLQSVERRMLLFAQLSQSEDYLTALRTGAIFLRGAWISEEEFREVFLNSCTAKQQAKRVENNTEYKAILENLTVNLKKHPE